MSLFNNSPTMRSLNMLEMGMDTAMLRRQVLANNVANVSVPHFKRAEVAFEADLRRAVESEKKVATEAIKLRTNSDKHFEISPYRIYDYRTVRPRVHIDYLSSMRNDGNNVDMEDESMKIVRNQLHYSLLANRVGGTFRQLNRLIRLA